MKFVIGRYLDDRSFLSMFEQVPVSTAQILHPEKYQANRKPQPTDLSGRKAALGKLPGVKLLMESALGEYYIQAILSQGVKEDAGRVREAAAGWAGETILVFQNGHGKFFVWDTLWDTPKDADEFQQCHLEFSKPAKRSRAFRRMPDRTCCFLTTRASCSWPKRITGS